MANRTLVLEDLKEQTIEGLLQEVVRRQEVLNVRLPDGGVVAIQPSQRLKELPLLEGFVPEGWKDAVYD